MSNSDKLFILTQHITLRSDNSFYPTGPAYCSPLLFAGHSIFALSGLSFNFLNTHTEQFANGHPLSNQGFSTLITDRAVLTKTSKGFAQPLFGLRELKCLK